MKITSIFSGAMIVSVLFASSAAMAVPNGKHERVNVNMPKLEMSIESGVKSGQLTKSEEATLRAELKQLGVAIKAALKDHKISKRENSRLDAKEAALSKHIRKLSNNAAVVKKHDDRRDAGPKKPDFAGKAPPKPDNHQNHHQQR